MNSNCKIISSDLVFNPVLYIDGSLLGSHFCIRMEADVYLRISIQDELKNASYQLESVRCEFISLNGVLEEYDVRFKFLGMINDFLKRINILYPDAMEYQPMFDEYASFRHGFSIKDPQNPRLLASCIGHITVRNIFYLKREHIAGLLKNFKRNINLVYDLYAHARNEFHRGNYRMAVLNCSTIVEVVLKKQLSAYLYDNVEDDKIVGYILNNMNGYTKIKESFKKIGIKFVENDMNTKLSELALIRNKVIHAGYAPSCEKVEGALNVVGSLLAYYQELEYVD